MGAFRRERRKPAAPTPNTTRSARIPSHRPVTAPAPARAPEPPIRTTAFSTHRSMVASARLVDISTTEARTKFSKRRASSQGWQDEAWAYVDAIGEIKYAFNLVANTLSRVRLYVGVIDDPSAPPIVANSDGRTGAAAIQALAKLESAFGGTPGMLRDLALNLQVAGEANLVQQPADPVRGIPESWDIRSTDELQLDSNGNVVVSPTEDGDKESVVVLPKKAFVARIWRPHPRYSDEPDSSMRGLLDTCGELLLLNKTFRSTARSRLNSGLLYLPDGLSVAGGSEYGPGVEANTPLDDIAANDGMDDPDYDPELDSTVGPGVLLDTEDADTEDEFEEALIEAMTTPIADEESASAVVPLIVRGPADLGEKIKVIKFERSFDPQLAERADRVLDRIMQGLDVPKDVVQGLSNIKYSNAVVIDQSLYTSHIEPLALLICDALTAVYLRPALKAQGIEPEEYSKYVVWYDASEVTTRPNKADDAEQGFQNYAVSWETWRKTHNFTEHDAPTPTEVATRMLIEKGPVTPELAEALLSVVAPDVMQKVREASLANNPAPLPPEVAQALGVPSESGEPTGTEESGTPPLPPTEGVEPEPSVIPESDLL